MEKLFPPSPFWDFSFERNCFLSCDGKRQISKRQSSFLSIPLPYQDKLTIPPPLNASGCSFSPSFPPLPPAFGEPQLISKPSAAAGGWYKGLIISLSLGEAGTGAGRAPSPGTAGLGTFAVRFLSPGPLPSLPPARPLEPTMDPQALWGCLCLLCFSLLRAAKGKGGFGLVWDQGLDGVRMPGEVRCSSQHLSYQAAAKQGTDSGKLHTV